MSKLKKNEIFEKNLSNIANVIINKSVPKKIIFVYPELSTSLGIRYLMAVSHQSGFETNIVHYKTNKFYWQRKSNVAIPYDSIAETIKKLAPQLVAFSCVTDHYQYQLNCAIALKKIMPNCIIIFGGVHVTAVPKIVIKNHAIDAIAIGEAEISFIEFCNKCNVSDNKFILPSEPIQGIVFKKNGFLVGEFTESPLPNLDELPLPHRSFGADSNSYVIMTSRGCPFSCAYCFNSQYHIMRGKKIIRQRTVANVIEELKYAKQEFAIKSVSFYDDAFTMNKKWILEFCEQYKKEIALPFACTTNPVYITKEIAVALSSACCYNIQIGVQSLSEHLCSNILKRKSSNSQISSAISIVKELKMWIHVDHMLGIPDDSISNQKEAVLFYNTLRPNKISVFWLTYYPQTEMCSIAHEKGLLRNEDINNIEEGKSLSDESFLTGGSMANPKKYYGIALMLKYLPFLPKFLVSFLIKSNLFRFLSINNYFISTVFPSTILSFLNLKHFQGREQVFDQIKTFFSHKKTNR